MSQTTELGGRDFIELLPGTDTLPRLAIPEGHVVRFGRAWDASIRHASVSRKHCELLWKSVPVLNVTALKRTMAIKTVNGDHKVIEPGGCAMEVREPIGTLRLK
jgi:hypothetical protein